MSSKPTTNLFSDKLPKEKRIIMMRENLDKDEPRLGEVNFNIYHHTPMRIVQLRPYIIVEFANIINGQYIISRKKTSYDHFREGKVMSNYDPTICGIGYIGDIRQIVPDIKLGGGGDQRYVIWKNMIERCYYNRKSNSYDSYRDCFVDPYFWNFTNFYSWYKSHEYLSLDNEIMCLDKDIKFKGNKIYGPNTCMIVPYNINMLFTKGNTGVRTLPIGVGIKNNKYRARCKVFNKDTDLGLYNSIEEAFMVYKSFKEKHIKEIANIYWNKGYCDIPQFKEIYEAMLRYTIEITD